MSHYELFGAFADDRVLQRVHAAAEERDYRAHEFGDSILIERQAVEVDACRNATMAISLHVSIGDAGL